MISPHWEALTSYTQLAFRKIANLDFIQRYYLAGGSGLALHIGHRFSVDLVFFSQEQDAVGPDERASFRKTLADPTLTITYDKDGTFVAQWNEVGLSFFCLDLYPRVQKPWILDGVPVATIEEIGAMKLAAIIDRGSRKDMVDLYFLLQHVPLEKLFEVAAIKYARVRSFTISATRAMAYFEDAESQPMPRMLDGTPWEKMRRFLEKQAMDIGRQHLENLWEF